MYCTNIKSAIKTRVRHLFIIINCVFFCMYRFLFKAKKAALITPAPVVPTMPRLMEDVVPDDRDDVDIILNTTTV